MKKLVVITLVVGLIGALSLGAYAYHGSQGKMGRDGMMKGQRGGMMAGPCGGMMAGQGRMHEFCPLAGDNAQNTICPRLNAQGQPGAAPQAAQVIPEDKAKQAAEEYVAKYLPGYTVDKIEKDNWRPMYFATVKGPNDVVQQMLIHGFSGQVMHVFPKTAAPAPAAPAPTNK